MGPTSSCPLDVRSSLMLQMRVSQPRLRNSHAMNGHLPLGALSGQRPDSSRLARCARPGEGLLFDYAPGVRKGDLRRDARNGRDARPGEGLLFDYAPGVRPARREPVFMALKRPCPGDQGTAQVGWRAAVPDS